MTQLYSRVLYLFNRFFQRSSWGSPTSQAIMTSGDTNAKTLELLEANAYFGSLGVVAVVATRIPTGCCGSS